MAIRVTQEVAEVVLVPTSQALRVTQAVAEPVITPTSQALRVTQVAAEPIIGLTQRKLRVTQVVAEVVLMNAVDTCEPSWTFPTIADYPQPANGGPYPLYFDEIVPEWGEYGQAMGDGKPLYGTLQTSRVRFFLFEYGGLLAADAATLDSHFATTRGALSFTMVHPVTAETITGVRYDSYQRSAHQKSWAQERTVRLVKYTN